MHFEVNFVSHLQAVYEKEVDSYSQSIVADKTIVEMKKLIIIYEQKLHHAENTKSFIIINILRLKAML